MQMRRDSFISTLILALVIATQVSAAGIYKTVDKDGNVTYTDNPPVNAESEEVKLKPINTQPGLRIEPKRNVDKTASQNNAPEKYTLNITHPSPNFRLGPADSFLNIRLESNQKLKKSLYFQVFIDGKQYGNASKSNVFIINAPLTMRGQRTITAKIIDRSTGDTVAFAGPVNGHIIRPN